MTPPWKISIDRGGTFTDAVAHAPDGRIHVAKVLSSDAAPVVAVRQLLGLRAADPVPACEIRIGTTVATNALLERRGRATALCISQGFADLLEIGTQARPELFALTVRKRRPLYRRVIETHARSDSRGNVLATPEARQLEPALRAAASDCDSLAVVVMHGYAAPQLEQAIAVMARAAGFAHVSLSHEVAAEVGLLARGETTVVDAYVTPLLRAYLDWLQAQLPNCRLRFMQSSGGLCDAAHFRGPAALLSGPAGGVVAAAAIARANGVEQLIGFDMGGTSSDVCRVDSTADHDSDDGLERRYESLVAGVPIRAPMLAIHTLAAGGGSICRFDEQRLQVGPQSAGSDPGPLCYGRPGANALTLSDVNLVLGRLRPDRFPFTLHAEPARAALQRIAAETGMASAEAVAAGFFAVACQHMASGIEQISVAKGHDPRKHALLLFGGAAGQHGCSIARLLGIQRLLLHPLSGVLSAYGIGLADSLWSGERDGGRKPLSAASLGALEPAYLELEARGRASLTSQGCEASALQCRRHVDLRYVGSDNAISLEHASAEALQRVFAARHEALFGYQRPGHALEIVSLRVRVYEPGQDVGEAQWEAAVGATEVADSAAAGGAVAGGARAARTTPLWFDGGFVQAKLLERADLPCDERVAGPAVLLEDTGTLVVEPGFDVRRDARGCFWLEATHGNPGRGSQGRGNAVDRRPPTGAAKLVEPPPRDPLQLELFHNYFINIAEQMGHVLQRTALSTNIRERLDFSCALFDRQGGLVANAPHIPVHLGAMEATVRALLQQHPEPQPGDAYVTNDPSAGGSHLPDITVVTPVFVAAQLRYFVASRGHHADIGGATPGSMPADSRCLADEGVVLRGLHLLRGGRMREEALRDVLRSGRHPARDIDQNLADLRAQLAANARGVRLLRQLSDAFGHALVSRYMRHVQDNAAEQVAAMIERLDDGVFEFGDRLDDGSLIHVRIDVAGAKMRIDFSRSDAQHPGNLNAPRAVTLAAVIYVLRLLVDAPIPLCSGCLRPVTLIIPPNSMLDPAPDAAVAAGNVETSQRIVDVLLGALGICAASQGTMNNLSFGNARFGYYETLGGGCGASAEQPGAAAVHSHMTNTRLTDPEVLETRFPVRVHELSVRRGSGGDGHQRGGDGLVRCIEALEPLQVTILSERRQRGAFGLRGGSAGQPGRNVLGGSEVGGRATASLKPGERIRIETPGGGGYGRPRPAPGATEDQ